MKILNVSNFRTGELVPERVIDSLLRTVVALNVATNSLTADT